MCVLFNKRQEFLTLSLVSVALNTEKENNLINKKKTFKIHLFLITIYKKSMTFEITAFKMNTDEKPTSKK